MNKKDKANTIPIYQLVDHLAWVFNEIQMQDLPEDSTEAVSNELESLIEWAKNWEEDGDEPTMLVQPEPSPLEVALMIYLDPELGFDTSESTDIAFNLIDAVRAEEAKRAGTP